MSLVSWLFRILLLLKAANVGRCFSRSAGGCAGGMPAVMNTHLLQDVVENGTLADFDFEILLDGVALQPGSTTEFVVGEEHNLTLASPLAPPARFRGFLFRLEGSGVDTTAALSRMVNDTDSQVADMVCVQNEGVGGLTHTSRRFKESASGVLFLNEAATGLRLDVTVVILNSVQLSEFAYDQFILDAVEKNPSQYPMANPSKYPVWPPSASPPSATPMPVSSPPAEDLRFCFLSLAVSDLNRDDLLDQSEYVRFLNRISENGFASYTMFEELPMNLKDLFWEFAQPSVAAGPPSDVTMISVVGTKPGRSVDPESDQGMFLEKFCSAAKEALIETTIPPVPSPTPIPTRQPSAPSSRPTPRTVSPPPTNDLRLCFLSLVISDLNRNDLLEQSEYVRFLNRIISGNVFMSSIMFEELPMNLQDLFWKFARLSPPLAGGPSSDGTMISVAGTKPGQFVDPESDQGMFLAQFCAAANAELAKFTPTPSPTMRNRKKMQRRNMRRNMQRMKMMEMN